MLSVENLKVVYRGVILALDGVSLEVGEGEAVALLGDLEPEHRAPREIDGFRPGYVS